MDYQGLIKSLALPGGAAAPRRLVYDDLVATAISRSDLADDVRGINASITLIRQTRGGKWPTGPVSEDYNYVDLVWHELEFREASSFTYVVRDAAGAYLGCCYLYPMGSRTPLTAELISYDVDVRLVGDARRPRRRLLHNPLRRTPPLAHYRVPLLEAVLLQHPDSVDVMRSDRLTRRTGMTCRFTRGEAGAGYAAR